MQTKTEQPLSLREKIAKKLGLTTDDGEEVKSGPKGVKSLGPRPVHFVSNGQIRRAMARGEAAAQRKTNERYRRRWMNNRLATAILRGKLQVAGLIPFADENFFVSEQDRERATAELTERHGSPLEALALYGKIQAGQ